LKEATVPGTGEKIYLHKEILITNKDLISATAKKTFGELFEVILTFREAAAKRIAKGMRFQSGRRLAILVDGKIISAPIIRGAIIDKAAISDWAMTKEKAERLANAINGR
jgi:preprotein translocase subunit SecD